MTTCCGALALGTLLCVAAAAKSSPRTTKQLVSNPRFARKGQGGVPTDWEAWRPVWAQAACTMRITPEGLRFTAPGRPYAVGGVLQHLRGVQGGQAYAVDVSCRVRRIASPQRSAMVRLYWTREGKMLHPAGWLVRGPAVADGVATFHDVLVAPKEADGARLSLEVKWPQGGSVVWTRASVRPAAMPKPRKAKLGAATFIPRNSTPEKNLEQWCAQIDAAGKLGLDAVCLGEAITLVGTGRSVADVAEPIPGPSTRRLGEAARRNKLYVIAGLNERDGDTLYNTAVLIDRKGKLAGTYRKVHLPREEWRQGIRPGTEYPVFRTDFGTVAIQICYDWFFPEAAEAFALHGAEVLFAPTWGNTLPDDDTGRVHGETTFRVRARDNGLYIVPCVYSGSSMVVDPTGRILASSKGRQGPIVWCEVDLATRERFPFTGHWHSIWLRHRMPDTYGPLTKEK